MSLIFNSSKLDKFEFVFIANKIYEHYVRISYFWNIFILLTTLQYSISCLIAISFCIKSRECWKLLQNRVWPPANEPLRIHFECGVKLAAAVFNLVIIIINTFNQLCTRSLFRRTFRFNPIPDDTRCFIRNFLFFLSFSLRSFCLCFRRKFYECSNSSASPGTRYVPLHAIVWSMLNVRAGSQVSRSLSTTNYTLHRDSQVLTPNWLYIENIYWLYCLLIGVVR